MSRRWSVPPLLSLASVGYSTLPVLTWKVGHVGKSSSRLDAVNTAFACLRLAAGTFGSSGGERTRSPLVYPNPGSMIQIAATSFSELRQAWRRAPFPPGTVTVGGLRYPAPESVTVAVRTSPRAMSVEP